jgi:hypothetical protein
MWSAAGLKLEIATVLKGLSVAGLRVEIATVLKVQGAAGLRFCGREYRELKE